MSCSVCNGHPNCPVCGKDSDIIYYFDEKGNQVEDWQNWVSAFNLTTGENFENENHR